MTTRPTPAGTANLHATTIDFNGFGLLIVGPSGAGKSALALQLMAFGAKLVADDRTDLCVEGSRLVARCPTAIVGRIEARGMGLIDVQSVEKTAIGVVVDLGRTETARLPDARKVELCGISLPCLYKIDAPHFPAALLQYIQSCVSKALHERQ